MTRLKVLVVDDDAPSLKVIGAAIASFGHDCRPATDGLEAWQLHQAEPADVILSDWDMPRMDGIELCRRTRVAHGERAYTYFIFMTSFADKAHFLHGMEAGADDYLTKPIDLDELRARLSSAQRVVSLYGRLAEKNTVLRRDSRTSFRLARVDSLTGVGNRLGLDEALGALWAQVKRYGHKYSVLLCDVDWFKTYNDQFGHLAGDAALQAVAGNLKGQLRKGDTLYRYGGEEFLVILPGQSAHAAGTAAERMRKSVERLGLRTPAGLGVVTVSIGVAEIEPADATVTELLNRADAALYAAKTSGRNRVELAPRTLPEFGTLDS